MTTAPDTPLTTPAEADEVEDSVTALRNAISSERYDAIQQLMSARAEREAVNARIRHLVSSVELYDRLLRSFTKTRRTKETKGS